MMELQNDSVEIGKIVSRINEAGNILSLDLTEKAVRQLAQYSLALQKWNKTYNLTALRTVDEILVQHIFDSLSIVPAVRAFFKERPDLLETGVVDVGSGAGLPGVVIAATTPEIPVSCVDAVQKKVAFITHAAGLIGCQNLYALHGRIEQLSPMGAGLVVSRAFASLRDFTQLSQNHVVPSGAMLAMKSRRSDDDIAELSASNSDWRVDRVDWINVPSMSAKRCLVWLERKTTHE
jgi:16S rRNA (guanine527-N7)-methyltransferase